MTFRREYFELKARIDAMEQDIIELKKRLPAPPTPTAIARAYPEVLATGSTADYASETVTSPRDILAGKGRK